MRQMHMAELRNMPAAVNMAPTRIGRLSASFHARPMHSLLAVEFLTRQGQTQAALTWRRPQ